MHAGLGRERVDGVDLPLQDRLAEHHVAGPDRQVLPDVPADHGPDRVVRGMVGPEFEPLVEPAEQSLRPLVAAAPVCIGSLKLIEEGIDGRLPAGGDGVAGRSGPPPFVVCKLLQVGGAAEFADGADHLAQPDRGVQLQAVEERRARSAVQPVQHVPFQTSRVASRRRLGQAIEVAQRGRRVRHEIVRAAGREVVADLDEADPMSGAGLDRLHRPRSAAVDGERRGRSRPRRDVVEQALRADAHARPAERRSDQLLTAVAPLAFAFVGPHEGVGRERGRADAAQIGDLADRLGVAIDDLLKMDIPVQTKFAGRQPIGRRQARREALRRLAGAERDGDAQRRHDFFPRRRLDCGVSLNSPSSSPSSFFGANRLVSIRSQS